MHAAVVLVNSEHPVAQAILARGMMEGLAFQTSTPTIEALKQKHAAVLAAFPSALQTYEKDGTRKTYLQIEGEIDELEIPDDAHRMLIGTGPTDGALEPNTCYVRLHDMLPPLPNSHDERMFYAWMEASGAKKTPTMEQRQRHWCDLNDAVPAIIEMLKGEQRQPSTILQAEGRGPWNQPGRNLMPSSNEQGLEKRVSSSSSIWRRKEFPPSPWLKWTLMNKPTNDPLSHRSMRTLNPKRVRDGGRQHRCGEV